MKKVGYIFFLSTFLLNSEPIFDELFNSLESLNDSLKKMTMLLEDLKSVEVPSMPISFPAKEIKIPEPSMPAKPIKLPVESEREKKARVEAEKKLPWNVTFEPTFKLKDFMAGPSGKDVLTFLRDQTTQRLKLLWDSFSWENFKEQYKTAYSLQHKGEIASVQKGLHHLTAQGMLDSSYYKEGDFIIERLKKAHEALNNVMDFKIEKGEAPRIGCAFSGGGYRSMITTTGFLKGLEDRGLLDAVLYISTLSGSTWCLAPWILFQKPNQYKSISEFRNGLLKKIQNNKLNISTLQHMAAKDIKMFIDRVFWPKIVFKQVVSSVDVYGAAVSYILLNDFENYGMTLHLSDMWPLVREGNAPWPIFTAVSMHYTNEKYNYNWYEFNPELITNLEHMLSLQTFSFNRIFERGESQDFAPEQVIGFMMGMFGSAYTINLEDVKRFIFGSDMKTDEKQGKQLVDWYNKPISWAQNALFEVKEILLLGAQLKFTEIWQRAKDNMQQIIAAVFAKFLSFVKDIKIETEAKNKRLGTMRFSPAQIRNPFKNYVGVGDWLKQRDFLTFIDAGISYNIPLRPLFRPERQLDIIIVGDATASALDEKVSADFLIALNDIKRVWEVEYKVDETIKGKVMQVYRPVQQKYPGVAKPLDKLVPPVIIYFNFFKDDVLIAKNLNNQELAKIIKDNAIETYDPEDCIKDFCDTFKPSKTCLEEFCGTFNFEYTQEQFKQLSGNAEFNIKAYLDVIKKIIEERYDIRRHIPEFGHLK